MSHIPIIGGARANAAAGKQQVHDNAADANEGEHHDEKDDATQEEEEQTGGQEEAQEEAKDEEHGEHKSQ